MSRFKGRVFGELGAGALLLGGLASVAAPACGETYELRAPDGAAGSGGTSTGGSSAAGGAPSGAGAPGSAGTSGGPSDCSALSSYETPEEECWGSFVAADENGVVTLTTRAAGGEPGAGQGGAGGASGAPSAAASGTASACATRDPEGDPSFELRGGFVTYERPEAPYRIDVWSGTSACERGTLLATTRGDGSAPGTLGILELPPRAESRPSSGAFTVELTSTTGAELRLRFQIVADQTAR